MRFSAVIFIVFFVINLTFANATISNHFSNKIPLTGYWQNFNNPAETPVRLTDIPDGYTTINIAFGEIKNDGGVTFTLEGPPYPSMANSEQIFKKDIKALQAKGIKVLLSLGGQNAIFQINSPAQENNFIVSLKHILNEYGLDGVDYDFENGLTSANVSYLVDATKRLNQDFLTQGKTLLFTMAPETLDVYWQVYPNGKYDPLIRSGMIEFIEVQLYNSGCMSGMKPGSACYSQGTEDFIVSQADSTIQTWIKNGISDASRKYVIGLPASLGAAGGGYLDLNTIRKALSCLKTGTECASYIPTQTYPDIGGFMAWSINWDAKNGYAFEKMIRSL